jgi:hypothetical protein
MKLIPEIKSAWKMFSIQAQTLALAILGAWTTIPPELKSNLPPDLVYWMAMGLMVAGIVGRLIQQPSVKE